MNIRCFLPFFATTLLLLPCAQSAEELMQETFDAEVAPTLPANWTASGYSGGGGTAVAKAETVDHEIEAKGLVLRAEGDFTNSTDYWGMAISTPAIPNKGAGGGKGLKVSFDVKPEQVSAIGVRLASQDSTYKETGFAVEKAEVTPGEWSRVEVVLDASMGQGDFSLDEAFFVVALMIGNEQLVDRSTTPVVHIDNFQVSTMD